MDIKMPTVIELKKSAGSYLSDMLDRQTANVQISIFHKGIRLRSGMKQTVITKAN